MLPAASTSPACVFLFDADGEFEAALKLKPTRSTSELDAADRSGWVCFDPHILFPGELEKALEFFAAFALRVSDRIPGRKLFVVDKIGRYVTGMTMGSS